MAAGVPEAFPGLAVLLAEPVAAVSVIAAGAPEAAAGEPEPEAVALGADNWMACGVPLASASARYISGDVLKNSSLRNLMTAFS